MAVALSIESNDVHRPTVRQGRRALFTAAALLLAGEPRNPARAQTLQPLTITTALGPARFSVELVDTPESRARGLMFRENLPPGQGMLFDFKEVQPVSFWMRNTLIPLDLLFISKNGAIARIHANARPLDETGIPSGVPILAVLEIAGGEARRLGIRAGDRVTHPLFTP